MDLQIPLSDESNHVSILCGVQRIFEKEADLLNHCFSTPGIKQVPYQPHEAVGFQ